MVHEVPALEPLSAADISLLMALLSAANSVLPWVEAKWFRREQHPHRKDIDRLAQLGYIRKERIDDKECYCVSVMAMPQMRDHPAIASILDTANSIWQVFRDHYLSSAEEPITLKTIADSIGVALDHVTLVHAYMRDWWHTPHCHTPADALYQAVSVREVVLDCNSFDECIEQLRRVRAKDLHVASKHAWGSPWLEAGPVAADTSRIPAFQEPSWFTKLPPHAQALMREIHIAKHAQLKALPAMGIRAVIDVVADDLLRSAGWGFAKKLTALREGGYLTEAQHQVIDAVVEVGHAASHRAHVPSERDLLQMEEVLEHVLCSAYGLLAAQQELAARTPPRP